MFRLGRAIISVLLSLATQSVSLGSLFAAPTLAAANELPVQNLPARKTISPTPGVTAAPYPVPQPNIGSSEATDVTAATASGRAQLNAMALETLAKAKRATPLRFAVQATGLKPVFATMVKPTAPEKLKILEPFKPSAAALRNLSIMSQARAAQDVFAQGRMSTPSAARPGALGTAFDRTTRRSAPQLVNAAQTSGAGMYPWWSGAFISGAIPGGGQYAWNVASLNLLVQSTDMDISHHGVAMRFSRTYNSLSLRDYVNSDGSGAGQYGNGWTNTFDAHIALNSAGGISVFDETGTRFDYSLPGGATGLTAPQKLIAQTGMQGTTLLTYDGGSYYWFKKTGETYVFYGLGYTGGLQAYNGRLYQIRGRNSNALLQFIYAWDVDSAYPGGDASSPATLRAIWVFTEGNRQYATLSFADFNGRRLLSSLTFPDLATTVTYSYDVNGNLASVARPGNNATSAPTETYSFRSGWLVVYSPRSTLSNFATDGGAMAFWTPTATGGLNTQGGVIPSAMQGVQSSGLLNFIPSDGTNTALQPGGTAGAELNFTWLSASAVGNGNTSYGFSDHYGHYSAFTFDTHGRVVARYDNTGTSGSVTTTGLATYAVWNGSNDQIATIDPRGNETDYVYDINHNPIAIAEPPVTTSTGTLRPLQLFSYDQFYNLIASCDPVSNAQASRIWSTTYATSMSDSLCPSAAGATRYTYSTQQIPFPGSATIPEPFGELTDTYTPLGYHTAYAYAVGPQGGTDFGTPTSATGNPGSPIAQNDGTSRTPVQSLTYDLLGNVTSVNAGAGSTTIAYDGLNRPTVVTDADNIASYTSYYPDGSVAETQTASQHAAGIGTTFTYDADGNETSETHHYGCISTTTCIANASLARPAARSQTQASVLFKVRPNFACPGGCTPPPTSTPKPIPTPTVAPTAPPTVAPTATPTVAPTPAPTPAPTATASAPTSFISGATQWWYDGADRVVEVKQPSDPNDYYSYPWLNRYLYDISDGGTAPTYRGTSIKAYGNLFKTQEYVGTQTSVPPNTSSWASTGWTDISASAYDPLDRVTATYKVVPAATLAGVTFANDSYRYDEGSLQGLLTSTTSKTGDFDTFSYDSDGDLTKDVSSNAATGTLTYGYDPAGRLYDANSSIFGDDITSYDLDGRLISRQEPAGGGVTDPVTLNYGYYPDGLRSSTTVVPQSGTVAGFSSTKPTKSYSYRNDDALTTELLNYNNTSYAFSWTYTAAGRTQTRNDPFASPAYTYAYDSNGRLQSKTMPNVSYTNIAYDLEDEPTGFNAYGTSVANSYSTRGELLGEAYGSDTCTGASNFSYQISSPLQWHKAQSANGFLFPGTVCNNGQSLVTNWDHNLATITGSQSTGQQYSYDPGGRMSATTANVLFARGGADVTCTNTTSRTYDGRDHLTAINSVSQASHDGVTCYTYYPGSSLYQWGPNNKLIRTGITTGIGSAPPSPSSATYETVHWDGDSLLFNSSGSSITNVNLDGLAEIFPGGSGYSQFPPWTLPGTYTFWVYDYNLAGGIDDARVSTAPHSTYNATTPAAEMDPSNEGPINTAGTLAPVSRDALSDGTIAVSGVRTIELGTSQWSTPDAADPASASAYVWDNSNPYMFRDPSGYAALPGSTDGADNPNGMGGLGNGSIGDDGSPIFTDPIAHYGMPYGAMGIWANGDGCGPHAPTSCSDAGTGTVSDEDFALFTAALLEILGTEGADGWERLGQRSSGIYEFRASSGRPYVGQSSNIASRVAQHVRSGKLNPADMGTLKITPVLGGKTAREVAEQIRILQLGGVGNLENIKNPIGPARALLLPQWARSTLGY